MYIFRQISRNIDKLDIYKNVVKTENNYFRRRSRHKKAIPHSIDLVCFHKRLIRQLIQILLGDRLDTGLTTQFFIILQLNIVVFCIKNDKLVVSIDIDDRNNVRDKCVLGLLFERFSTR